MGKSCLKKHAIGMGLSRMFTGQAQNFTSVSSVTGKGQRDSLNEFHRCTFFIGAMHFMDLYNMDIERVKRCGVHYATPDGRIIPFCTYNTIHRKDIERKFAVVLPLARAKYRNKQPHS